MTLHQTVPPAPPPTFDGDPFAGLSLEDRARIEAAMTASHTESTRTVYRNAWRAWERWCTTRSITTLPASPTAICAYLTERAATGASVGTLDNACSAISYEHRCHGLVDPVRHEGVRLVRRGLRRTLGTAPRRLARPLTVDEIGRIVASIDRTTPIGARDAAVILIGYASALRRSELVALTLADVGHRPGGLLPTIRRSKTDTEGRGQVVGVAHGRHPDTDPVAALSSWMIARGGESGPVFTRCPHGVPTAEPIVGETVSRMLRDRAAAAGLDPFRITGHSLRAGHATAAALAGVSLDRIAAQTRHKRLSTLLNHYIRPAQMLDVTSSRDLGL